jgi:hypothetical protein
MISFSKVKDETPSHVEKVKSWVEHWLSASSSSSSIGDQPPTVMVSQIKCTEQGCAPIETVVSLLQPNNNKSGKIFKPIKDVTQEETIQLLETLCTK